MYFLNLFKIISLFLFLVLFAACEKTPEEEIDDKLDDVEAFIDELEDRIKSDYEFTEDEIYAVQSFYEWVSQFGYARGEFTEAQDKRYITLFKRFTKLIK